MLRLVKYGSITLGTGVLVGASVVAWLYTHRLDDPVQLIAKSGTVGLLQTNQSAASDDASSPAPSAQPLSVTNPGATTLGPQTAAQAEAQATPTPLPGPSGFGVYEQYKDNPAALYIDVETGTGSAVAAGSSVTLQYRGWLSNGTEFDETYARGSAFTFTEGDHAVIAGFEEGLYGMKVGGKRRLIIPASQGYGSTAQGSIPANSMLLFDVELVSVK